MEIFWINSCHDRTCVLMDRYIISMESLCLVYQSHVACDRERCDGRCTSVCRSWTNLVMGAAQKIIPFTMTIVNEWGTYFVLKFELIILWYVQSLHEIGSFPKFYLSSSSRMGDLSYLFTPLCYGFHLDKQCDYYL